MRLAGAGIAGVRISQSCAATAKTAVIYNRAAALWIDAALSIDNQWFQGQLFYESYGLFRQQPGAGGPLVREEL